MTRLQERLLTHGLQLPDLLLPKEAIDYAKWAVIACDQYTQEKDYWERVEQFVGKSQSTLRLILPECFIGDGSFEDRIDSIHATMCNYLQSNLFQSYSPGIHLVKRSCENSPDRLGILLLLDLEAYDYRPGSQSLIRPTEGTIAERIPPRSAIRYGAPVEVPHVLVLLDDPDHSVIEPFEDLKDEADVLYDFDLMSGGGRLSSFRFDSEQHAETLTNSFDCVADSESFRSRYGSGKPFGKPFFLAVGDGNHSLAAAKTVWESVKSEHGREAYYHPARWALVEVVNLYNRGIGFEPIHRLLFGIKDSHFLDYCREKHGAVFRTVDGAPEVERIIGAADSRHPEVGIISGGVVGALSCRQSGTRLAVVAIQEIIDDYLQGIRVRRSARRPARRPARNPASMDFVHDAETMIRQGRVKGNVGILVPPIRKEEFFPYLINYGSLPRKSFSLGKSQEKRYYMEARKIIRT